MAKVKFAADVQSISGKLCSREGVVYSVNKQTGETYRSDRHGYNDPNTEAQQQVRATFKSRAQVASSWWKANKPSASNAAGSANYQLVMKAYRSQHKIGNPYSYLRSLVTSDLKVCLGDLDITSGASAPAQGGGSQTGGSSSSGSGSTSPSGPGVDG